MAREQGSKKRARATPVKEKSSPTRKIKRSADTSVVGSKRQQNDNNPPLDHESEDQAGSSAKRSRILKGLCTDNIITTSSKSSPLNFTPSSSDNTSPIPVATKRTSGRERSNVNYDMLYHPAGKRAYGFNFPE